MTSSTPKTLALKIKQLLAVFIFMCCAAISNAQMDGTVDQQLSLLSDTQARTLLREELQNKLQNSTKAVDMAVLDVVRLSLQNTLMAFESARLKIFEVDHAIAFLVGVYEKDLAQSKDVFNALLQLLYLIIVALLVEMAISHFMQIGSSNKVICGGRFVQLGKIAIVRLVKVAVFYAMIRLGLPYLFDQNSFLLSAYSLLDYVTIARLTYIGCAYFFAPRHPQLRLFNIDDQLAKSLLRRLVVVSLFSGLSIFVELFKELGIKQGEYKLGFWTSIITYVSMIVAVFFSRGAIRKMLLHSDSDNSKQRIIFANIWPSLVVVCIVLIWFTLEVVVANVGFDDDIVYAATFTMLAILAVPFFDIVLITLVDSYYPNQLQQSAMKKKLNKSLRSSVLRILRVITFMALLFSFSILWGIEYLSLASQGFVAVIITRLIEAAILLLCGLISWEVVNVYIQRKLAHELPESDEESMDSEGGQGLSRAATLLPLIRNSIAFLILVLSVMGALSTLGFNTTALLAGAGVLGLAIGFGAQTLVKDIVSGVFFLIDDAFRMGEYVVIGSTMGTVEKIALRSLRLRHHLGALHTIPYGEIPSLTNYSRDWVIMKLPFRVPHDTDINKVKKLFKLIGKELLKHPELGKDFIEPFKSQGVLSVDEIGMLIRGKFTCKPGAQFMIRKEVFLRVQQVFAANNIEFAKRKVEVQIPKDIHPSLIGPMSAAASETVQPAAVSNPIV